MSTELILLRVPPLLVLFKLLPREGDTGVSIRVMVGGATLLLLRNALPRCPTTELRGSRIDMVTEVREKLEPVPVPPVLVPAATAKALGLRVLLDLGRLIDENGPPEVTLVLGTPGPPGFTVVLILDRLIDEKAAPPRAFIPPPPEFFLSLGSVPVDATGRIFLTSWSLMLFLRMDLRPEACPVAERLKEEAGGADAMECRREADATLAEPGRMREDFLVERLKLDPLTGDRREAVLMSLPDRTGDTPTVPELPLPLLVSCVLDFDLKMPHPFPTEALLAFLVLEAALPPNSMLDFALRPSSPPGTLDLGDLSTTTTNLGRLTPV